MEKLIIAIKKWNKVMSESGFLMSLVTLTGVPCLKSSGGSMEIGLR